MHTFALGIITIASVIQLWSSSPNVTAAPTLLQFHLSPIRCNRDSWQCRYGPTTPPLRLLAPTAFPPNPVTKSSPDDCLQTKLLRGTPTCSLEVHP
ncbi:hypothetical protein EV363DRAFT_1354484 [Boletus edulis]|nr:hypothetical protein EV363DRAFT_1354484 [Boletus edulis]